MSTIIIDRKEVRLGYRNGAIELRLPDRSLRQIPLRGTERLVIRGAVIVSSGLLAQCWERRISVLFLSGRRNTPGARFHGHPHNDAAVRVAQILACHNPDLRLRAARMLVMAKLRRQQRLLEVLGKARPGGARLARRGLEAISGARAALAQSQPDTLDALRGIEGAAAAGYFHSFTTFFPSSLGFENRRRRPPPDPVNAALSLGYTLATFEAGRAATIAGLDPAVGALHSLAHGRDALALDLVEPLRPLVDRFVHRLFHERRLVQRHFTIMPEGGVLLGKAGRQHFYAAWEDAAPALRRLARGQARLVVRWLRTQGRFLNDPVSRP